jgi:signal transduction histidine kinase
VRGRSLPLAAALAVAGALGALAVGLAADMPGGELGHLAFMLAVAVPVTLAVVLGASRLLSTTSLRRRLVGIAALSGLAGLANLAALAALMLVDHHDVVLVAALLVYSLGVGAGTALALGRSASSAIARLEGTASRLAAGDLSARVGRLQTAPELNALAETLDEMAGRLDDAIRHERTIESQRHDLITAVSHDLRTPLASLRAMVEAIDDEVVEDRPTMRRYAGEMRRSIGSLVDLVDDLFELVQLEASAIEAEARRATVEEIVGAAVAACDGQAMRKGLRVETHLDGTEDTPCSPHLGRVLQNLLQNAIRHTPADGTVRVEADRDAGGLRLTVSDDGEGIPPEALEHIFDPFWRGDAARAGEGSGIGLTLAKRIVESLGGQIRVESTPATGSRFAVVVPERA